MALKLLKFAIGLALAPLVAAEVWTLIDLARSAVPAGQWRQAWFVAFGAGFVTWLAVFFLLPRTTWVYVFGHEMTHALSAMLAGGKVSSFHVTAKGGHVVTDKVNWWITLAPYFVPLYAILWGALWVSVDFWYPLQHWQPILFFGLGLLGCFHITFTASMVRLGQTDLASQGIVFSLVVILLINLLFFLLLAAMLAHDFTWLKIGYLFLHCIKQSYLVTAHGIWIVGKWLVDQTAHLIRN